MTRSGMLCVLLIALAPHLAWSQETDWQDPAEHAVHAVVAAPFVILEVLDYGGTGEPLVFLAGLGNSAHLFDGFASRFTDRFHVYAISRRGYGSSSRPAGGYDVATRTRDILSVIDDLGIERAIFAGHSIAGDELTRLGTAYQDRVRALIYLDAVDYGPEFTAFLAGLPPVPQSAPPPLSAADSSSAASYSAYRARFAGVEYPEAEIRVHTRFDGRGRYAGVVARPDRDILDALVPGSYEPIVAPSLAIYPAEVESVQQMYRGYEGFDAANRAAAEQSFEMWQAYLRRIRNRFRSEAGRARIAEVGGTNHFIFLSHPDEVEEHMRNFLREGLGGE